jgi:hypothetical protein
VVLDPFPVGNYLSSLQALALGVPVVTLPADSLGGRTTLALYQMIGYGYSGSERDDLRDSDRNTRSGQLEPEASKKPAHFTIKANVLPLSGAADVLKSSPGSSPVTTFGDDAQNFKLVVTSVQEYVNAAMALAHKPKLRLGVGAELVARRDRLFTERSGIEATEDWQKFVTMALKKPEAVRYMASLRPPSVDSGAIATPALDKTAALDEFEDDLTF